MKKLPKISNGARIFLISFLFLLLGLNQVQAAGLVPCGPGTEKGACEFCDLFVMINNIIREIMFKFVPVIAALMLIIGGVMFFFAGAKADTVNRAKGIITSVVIGLLIIFSAWVIVNTVFDKIGIVELKQGWHWYEIGCSI